MHVRMQRQSDIKAITVTLVDAHLVSILERVRRSCEFPLTQPLSDPTLSRSKCLLTTLNQPENRAIEDPS